MTDQERRSASLDPQNWDGFAEEAHRALDVMIDDLRTIRERPVWQTPPHAFWDSATIAPVAGRPMRDVIDDFTTHILPFGTGNRHPGFTGWVHGAGTPAGMVAEMLAAGLNANCGGRDHVGLLVEQAVVRWMAALLGMPEASSGVVVTGTSMATFLAVVIARHTALGVDFRSEGMAATRLPLAGYTSANAHASIVRAFEVAGIGSASLRRVASGPDGTMLPEALDAAVAEDLAAGFQPFFVAGTAGSVETGAIDDLAAIAAICRRRELWFHVDGAFGALGMLARSIRPMLAGIGEADSIALDFHKWLHVPYDAGLLLCRHPQAHRAAFAQSPSYLARAERGLAAGEDWPCDLGIELSRGFRALKIWFALEHFGTERLGASIEHGCAMARLLARQIDASPGFELRAPVPLNIVCFGIPGSDGARERRLVMDLQESGMAAPSAIMIDGRTAIRCAILNHRTTQADIHAFVTAAERALTC